MKYYNTLQRNTGDSYKIVNNSAETILALDDDVGDTHLTAQGGNVHVPVSACGTGSY